MVKTTRHDQWIAWGLFILIGTVPLAVVFAHRAMAPILILGGLFCATRLTIWREGLFYFLFRPNWRAPLVQAMYGFGVLCLWIFIAGFWAEEPGRQKLALNMLIPVFAMGAWIWTIQRWEDQRRMNFLNVIWVALAVGLFLLSVEAITRGGLRSIVPPADESWFRHKDWVALARGCGALILLGLPVLASASIRRKHLWFLAGAFVIVGLCALRFGVSANLLALIAGVVGFIIARRFSAHIGLILATIGGGILLVSPFLALMIPADLSTAWPLVDELPVSWQQRLFTWSALGDEIMEGLPWGYGPDHIRHLMRDGPLLDIEGAFAPLPLFPTHAHQASLQIWLELGLPGVVAVLGILIALGRALDASGFSITEKAAIAALGFACMALFVTEMSIWQVWRWSVIGLASTLMAAIVMKTR